MRLPLWYLEILSDALPALQAEELINAMAAARSAWLDKNDYRRMLGSLQRLATPHKTDEPIRMAETPEEKAAAAEFFKAAGVKLQG